MWKAYPAVIVGFGVGALIGFAWAQQTKASLADNVSTKMDGGVVVVRINAAKAAAEGLYSLLGVN